MGHFFKYLFSLALFISGGDTNLCFFQFILFSILKPITYSVSFWKNHAFVVCKSIL